MAQYEEGQIEFAILSLVRDPLLDLVPDLAENVKSIVELSKWLDIIKPDWEDFVFTSANGEAVSTGSLLTTSEPTYGLTQEDVDQAKLSSRILDLLRSGVISDIIEYRQELITTQAKLRMSIREEQQSNQSDDERAATRSCDYGARIQNFVRKMRAKRECS